LYSIKGGGGIIFKKKLGGLYVWANNCIYDYFSTTKAISATGHEGP
jgi:hypothetical protein